MNERQEKSRRHSNRENFYRPHPLGGPSLFGLPPFMPPFMFGGNVPFHRPHPQLHFFKKFSTVSNFSDINGKKSGKIEVTKEFPSEDGIVVQHFEKNLGDDQKTV